MSENVLVLWSALDIAKSYDSYFVVLWAEAAPL